jgi:hypothetical protein
LFIIIGLFDFTVSKTNTFRAIVTFIIATQSALINSPCINLHPLVDTHLIDKALIVGSHDMKILRTIYDHIA